VTELFEDQRTKPIGLFNFATTYWKAAKELHRLKVKSNHPNEPVSFLYCQAIDLYLKSFLRLHGITTEQLRSRKYRHSYKILSKKALELGLSFGNEDMEVFLFMDIMNALIRARYISTGIAQVRSIEALERTCKRLDNNVYNAFIEAGIPLRRK
jgi:hypothetical protein